MMVSLCGCQKDANIEKLTLGSNGPYSFNDIVYFRTDAIVFDKENKSTEYIQAGIDEKLYFDKESAQKDILIGNENFMRVYVVEKKEYTSQILNCFEDYVLISEATREEYGSVGVLDRKNSVEELQNTFEKITYSIEKDADEIYILEAGAQNQESFNKKYFGNTGYSVGDYWNTEMPHFYVGMIIVKNNEMYYGNLDNRIEGELKTNILEILNK